MRCYSPRHLINFQRYCFLITIAFLFAFVHSEAIQGQEEFRVYPVTDGLFEKIYLAFRGTQSYYVVATCRSKNILSLSINPKINFQEAPRYDIYGNIPNKPKNSIKDIILFSQCSANLSVTQHSFISIRRAKQSKTIFSISDISINQKHQRIVVNDQSMKWGLGQRFQSHFEVRDGHWTIWNRDRPWEIDQGLQYKSAQTYGHQPVYLAKQWSLSGYHMVYFKNTHGMMIESTQQSSQLVYNSVGGNIHFIIVIGGYDPQQTIQTYHEYIGPSAIPPFWSLGYHQSRWGYKSITHISTVIDQFNNFDIPIDTFWLDLDYMKDKMIFQIDQKNYPPKQLNQLFQKNNLKLVPLLDVGIAVKDSITSKMARNMKVLLRSRKADQYHYLGQVWPGQVYYVDFLHPNASTFWQNQLSKLYKQIKFAGIWLDMNQPTNFKGGIQSYQPYLIQKNQNLNTMTIDCTLNHFNPNGPPFLHQEVHAYYGHFSALPTYQFLEKMGRPFILTRSNSVGTGVFAAHWTGDNVANWQFLKSSINSNFLFQIFGIQMVGSDICGFYKDSQEDLCSRWMQLGAFYPFARNHNHQSAIPQEPYSFGSAHAETSRRSLKTRYALLKQMYTWMVIKKGLGSFFRPVFFQFYEDNVVFYQKVVETQFLIGKALMVAPIVEKEVDERSVYFPGQKTQWYEFQINSGDGKIETETVKLHRYGWNYVVENKLPNPPLTFLRSGFMIFPTVPENRSNQLKNTFFPFVALNEGVAEGIIMALDNYQDNTKLTSCIEVGCIYHFKMYKVGERQYVLQYGYQGIFSGVQIVLNEIIVVDEDELCKIRTVFRISQLKGEIPINSAHVSCSSL